MYLLCGTNEQSVTTSSSAEEGRIHIPPTSSSPSMEAAPGPGAAGRQTHAAAHTKRKEQGSLPRVCSCSSQEEQ